MIRPHRLNKGDKIDIVAPAGNLVEGTLETGINIIESWGLNVELGEHLTKGSNYFSGTDVERLHDLQKALDDSDIKAIFCARGGYGTTRIIDSINWEGFRKYPKWIIGFSDITALHFQLHQLGYQSVHAIMPTGFAKADPLSVESLRKLLFLDHPTYNFEGNPNNRPGQANGVIIGGNLSLINDSIGTASDIDFTNKILFIEELDEYLYKIDRMLVQLKRAGKLAKLKGLIIGNMTGMKDTTVPFGANIHTLIFDHVKEYNYPIAFNIPIGHEPLNMAIPHGSVCKLNVSDKAIAMSFE